MLYRRQTNRNELLLNTKTQWTVMIVASNVEDKATV